MLAAHSNPQTIRHYREACLHLADFEASIRVTVAWNHYNDIMVNEVFTLVNSRRETRSGETPQESIRDKIS
ncbi:MAG: hypothetical protein KK482_09065 [Sinorhizobium meliloti]|nr:hypothetical protein [Sinorhizobium meliloti]